MVWFLSCFSPFLSFMILWVGSNSGLGTYRPPCHATWRMQSQVNIKKKKKKTLSNISLYFAYRPYYYSLPLLFTDGQNPVLSIWCSRGSGIGRG